MLRHLMSVNPDSAYQFRKMLECALQVNRWEKAWRCITTKSAHNYSGLFSERTLRPTLTSPCAPPARSRSKQRGIGNNRAGLKTWHQSSQQISPSLCCSRRAHEEELAERATLRRRPSRLILSTWQRGHYSFTYEAIF